MVGFSAVHTCVPVVLAPERPLLSLWGHNSFTTHNRCLTDKIVVKMVPYMLAAHMSISLSLDQSLYYNEHYVVGTVMVRLFLIPSCLNRLLTFSLRQLPFSSVFCSLTMLAHSYLRSLLTVSFSYTRARLLASSFRTR